MKTAWGWLWGVIAAPFGYATVLCSLIGHGPKTASEWAAHVGLPWPKRRKLKRTRHCKRCEGTGFIWEGDGDSGPPNFCPDCDGDSSPNTAVSNADTKKDKL